MDVIHTKSFSPTGQNPQCLKQKKVVDIK